MKVYLLYHEHELDDCEDIKLIGVYESQEQADNARRRSARLPGFKDHAEGFSVGEYVVGRDHWTSGFVTVKASAENQDTSPDRAA